MNIDEAREAGLLAEALSELEYVRDCARTLAAAGDGEPWGVGFYHEISDGGATGIGSGSIAVPVWLAEQMMDALERRIRDRLLELGVELAERADG